MADAAQNQMVEIDPDFEPLSRPRSCTWPLPRPEFPNPAAADSNTSSPAPSVKQEPSSNTDFINNLSLLEENEDYPDQKPLMLCGDFQENCIHQQQTPSHQQQVPVLSSPVAAAAAAAAAAQRKSSSSRRNAWGNMSYADLITKAIESTPEKRLTLSQIYDWMVKNVPYFKDKGDSNSSAGWKVFMFSVLVCTLMRQSVAPCVLGFHAKQFNFCKRVLVTMVPHSDALPSSCSENKNASCVKAPASCELLGFAWLVLILAVPCDLIT